MSEKLAVSRDSETVGEFWSRKPARARTSNFDPLSYFRSILKYRWPIILFTALVTALAIAYVLNAEPLYRSTQSLLLESSRSNIVDIEDLVKDAPRDEGYVQTRIEMLKSREHGRRVINSLGLLNDAVFMANLAKHARLDIGQLMVAGNGGAARSPVGVSNDVNVADTAAETVQPAVSEDAALAPMARSEVESLAIEYLRSRLSFEQIPTTRLLRISYLSSDPELSARIANEVGLQYIQAYVESVQSKVAEVSGWLGVKLEELKETLDDSEARLLAFKQDNQLVDIRGSVLGLTEQELLQTSSELAEARFQLSNARIVLDQIENANTTEKLLEILPSARSDLMILRTQEEINRLNSELDRELLKYGERHPNIVNMRSQLNSRQSDLRQSVQRAIESARSDYVILQRRVDSIESRLANDRQAVQMVDEKSIQYDLLETEVETNRELYYRFLNRMIETRSTEGLESVNATVAEYATPSLNPVKPRKGIIVALAFIGALVLSMLAALIASGLDDSIKYLADVEHSLGERLIGIIPLYRKKERLLTRFLPFRSARRKKETRMFAEAFTTARTNLMLDQVRDSDKILLLTSSVPGEGKSMSSIGLARAYARIERVLLIDADIRRPSIGPALKFDRKTPGLTNYVAGKNRLSECIKQHQKSGFDVMCSGPATSQPLEMLSSSQFGDMLHEVAQSYDRIIIDCAPIEAVSDALLLSKLADQVIYIVKSHDTSVRVINSGLEKLRSVDAPLVGVLLTQVDLEKLAAYGADYEFHGHYDYYGYASADNEQALTMDRDKLRSRYSGTRSSRSRPATLA